MLPITSLQNPTIKLIRSLGEKKHRKELGLFIAEGEKVLDRARLEGWIPDYLLAVGPVESWGGATLLTVDEKVMAAVSAQNNPPAQAGVFRQRWAPDATASGVWVAVEDLRDPGNLGTIIRTVDAAGAKGVILALTEGGAHTIVRFNDNFVTTIPRHKEISEMTARSILKDAANA